MAKEYGRYEGAPPVVSLLDDGRLIKLMKPFAYINVKGIRWPVPRNAQVDGASIPRPLWSVIGGPFEGKYRNASIVHDWYCDVRSRAWQDVHRMFHEALLASGVGARRAMLMYAAVSRFGPRWSTTTSVNTRLASRLRMVYQPATNGVALKCQNLSMKYGDPSLAGWLTVSTLGYTIPDDRRGAIRDDFASGTTADAYTLPFNKTDLAQLVESVTTRNLTLEDVDAIVDAQALGRYQRAAQLGKAATFRQAYV